MEEEIDETVSSLDEKDDEESEEQKEEEHTSELQSRSIISYAVFCLKKKSCYF